ncbi:CaiB/BaiF CoA-transferase family protein [Sphingopyxis terrae]|uniref:CaiB/BaiF CoA-transferase family protein n=1 Tax=Sphingopyxis terrae TaxID=33052 RepID=UPI002A163C8F|nr:CoA transferase [Sphingopyxis terrae]MDX8356434.1 CoA transferase [Sphingopyxis terrae]
METGALSGIRVVDAVSGPLAAISKHLQRLGARVDRIVPDASRYAASRFEDIAANFGKTVHQVSLHSAAAQTLLGEADVIIIDAKAIDLAPLLSRRPKLVAMEVSDFGKEGPLSSWLGSDPILHALSGELSRSGIRGRPPLLPPNGIGYQCAATQALYAILASLYAAERTGIGDAIEFTALDGAVQALDPGFGVGGSATGGRPAKLLPRDRPPRGVMYPIFRCKDGLVRVCLLAPRQWRGMLQWMGNPARLQDAAFNDLMTRFKSTELSEALAAFFADQSQAELEAEAQRHGVPLASVATLSGAIQAQHFVERGSVRRMTGDDGRSITLPTGAADVRLAAADRPGAPARPGERAGRPDSDLGAFAGLRVLDLGVIVVGAETGRLFADQGADVIKIESRDFPDGNRASYLPYDFSPGFALGHRNKRSLGLDLRSEPGKKLFLDLVAKADIVLSNFKPGTMESLGLDDATLRAANPDVIAIESSAFGSSGSWRARMGYGPLVRAATGLTDRWSYSGENDQFADSVTIYPDHAAARVGAAAAIALLIHRERHGGGGTASISQSEVMFDHFAADIARLNSDDAEDDGLDAPWGVFEAAGDDEWCVVTVHCDAEWRALAPILGLAGDRALDTRAGRRAGAERINRALGAWMADRGPSAAAQELQDAGVPAAPMLRVGDLPDFSYFTAREFFRIEQHAHLPDDLIVEARHVAKSRLPAPGRAPAPLAGEQSVEVVSEWTDLGAEEIEKLVADGVIQPTPPAVYEKIRRFLEEARSAPPKAAATVSA